VTLLSHQHLISELTERPLASLLGPLPRTQLVFLSVQQMQADLFLKVSVELPTVH